jgi:hypothetical protein
MEEKDSLNAFSLMKYKPLGLLAYEIKYGAKVPF